MSRGPMPASGSAGYKSPPVVAPKPPDWMGEEALREWDRIVPLLLRAEMIAEVDQMSLAAYCQACAELVECTRVIEQEGRFLTEIVQNAKGDILGERKRAHPALGAQRDALARIKSYLAEFGLTPAARVRMKLVKDGGADALAAILADAA